MEEELKCPSCRQFLCEPILLNCAHSYCRECAIRKQVKVSTIGITQNNINNSSSIHSNTHLSSPPSSSGGSDSVSLCVSDADQESNDDKLSVFSETDSGVVIYAGSRGSRPNSFLGFSSSPGLINSINLLPNFGFGSTSITNNRLSNASAAPLRLQNAKSTNATPTGYNSLILSILSPSTSGYVLTCEICRKPSYFPDENFVKNVKENLALRRVLQKFNAKKNNTKNISSNNSIIKTLNCQWCENQSPNIAKIYCENCSYFYCDTCQPVIHPPRGPLKNHVLVPANSVYSSNTTINTTLNRRLTLCGENSYNNNEFLTSPTSTSVLASLENWDNYTRERFCESHTDEILTMFCEVCRIAICEKCLNPTEVRHLNHEVQNLGSAAKLQKTELSQTLQCLSEKAKTASEEITKLKLYNEKINTNFNNFVTELNHEFDLLTQLLENRRQKLIEFVEKEREKKRLTLREQITKCSQHLNRTTALIQFSIELLKEPDPIAYLQIGNALANRVTNQEFLWSCEMNTKLEVDPTFQLNLDAVCAQFSIQSIDFIQYKADLNMNIDHTNVPPIPCFDPSECSAENNVVVLSWRCPNTNATIDGYILEIDLGWNDEVFKEVYCGAESICTIDGLHFNTLYNARVKAFNNVGESAYSETICLQTAHVAWFQLSPTINNLKIQNTNENNNSKNKSNNFTELLFTNDYTTVTGTTMEYRTCLGTVAFSRGVHYWEVSVDRYEGNADIVLGVAQPAVNTRLMLGKDIHGWSMYIDDKRLWFLHNDVHNSRHNFGLASSENSKNLSCINKIIGVLIDCDRGMLLFFINDLLISSAEFKNMPHGLYYPAISVNQNATVSIHTGLEVPSHALSILAEDKKNNEKDKKLSIAERTILEE